MTGIISRIERAKATLISFRDNGKAPETCQVAIYNLEYAIEELKKIKNE